MENKVDTWLLEKMIEHLAEQVSVLRLQLDNLERVVYELKMPRKK